MHSDRPHVISLVNQKGGCGKSSLCFHLAGFLADIGKSVLLIDADPQGSLGRGFLGTEYVDRLQFDNTLACVLTPECYKPDPSRITSLTPHKGIWLIPSNHLLAPLNSSSPELSGMSQFLMQSFLRRESEFDIILIDCPPNLYQCTWNALLASDWVVIPVPPEDFGTQGLPAVHQAVEQARRLNPQLEILGHVISRADRRLLIHKAFERKLRQIYGHSIMETAILEASAFKLALASRTPVTAFAPKSRAALLTESLGYEIQNRMRALQPAMSASM